MGKESNTNPRHRPRDLFRAVLWTVSLVVYIAAARAQTNLALRVPGGVAFDPQGDLFLSDISTHKVWRLSSAGILTVAAGTGVQGFSGDGASALAAELDSPGALAEDSFGNLFIADSHNHRIRRVDASTGLITTFAGTGLAGYGADGGAASATALDLPSALAVDKAQNLLFADARTHVVRRIDHLNGSVTTIVGSTMQGFGGDGSQAVRALLDTPSAIVLDGAGNLFLCDTHNHRIRRVDGSTGIITTVGGGPSLDPDGLAMDANGNLLVSDPQHNQIVRLNLSTGQLSPVAGNGVQKFAGDEAPALTSSLDQPGPLAISPAGLPTFSDVGNQRIRQIDAAGMIHTIIGIGAVPPAALSLNGPSAATYGTGDITAALSTSGATGTVTFLDGTTVLGAAPLLSNTSTFSISGLAAGNHVLTAAYSGDPAHAPLRSSALSVLIQPATLIATPNALSLVYGQTVPALTANLNGVLPADANAVTLNLVTPATGLSVPGSYAITGSLVGAAAGNYSLSLSPALVTITRAPSFVSLSNSLGVHVSPGITGVPSGTVSLLDGTAVYATLALSSSADAQFSSLNLSNGSHTLSASYNGDGDFLPARSAAQIVSVLPAASADFSIASAGAASVSVVSGSPAVFSFAAVPVNGSLASPIVLSASGVPPGATASFSPAYLPPGAAPANFTLTIQTQKTAWLGRGGRRNLWTLAVLLPLLAGLRRRIRRSAPLLLLGLLAGCGDRVTNVAVDSTARTYNVTVTATATGTSGAVLVHSATVTLTLQ